MTKVFGLGMLLIFISCVVVVVALAVVVVVVEDEVGFVGEAGCEGEGEGESLGFEFEFEYEFGDSLLDERGPVDWAGERGDEDRIWIWFWFWSWLFLFGVVGCRLLIVFSSGSISEIGEEDLDTCSADFAGFVASEIGNEE